MSLDGTKEHVAHMVNKSCLAPPSSSSECHHPRSSLPVWSMLSAAVSAGRPVYPRAHGARHEAWSLQEAQQRGTESLPQPPGQRGRGQGAPAGGQQRITSAKGGGADGLTPPQNPCTWTETHIFTTRTRSHLRHTSDWSAVMRSLCLCVGVHSTKVGSRSLAALFIVLFCFF